MGYIYELDGKIELEGGFKYTMASASKGATTSMNGDAIQMSQKIDGITYFGIAANYKF